MYSRTVHRPLDPSRLPQLSHPKVLSPPSSPSRRQPPDFVEVLKTHSHDNLETCLIVLVPYVSDRKGITGVEDIGLNEERSGRITLACRALTAA